MMMEGAQAVTIDQMVAAVRTLFNATDENSRAAAERWISAFRETPEAWQMAEMMVRAQGTASDIALFGAMMLQYKVRAKRGMRERHCVREESHCPLLPFLLA